MHQPHPLILASASPARRELLTRAGYQFDVVPSDIPEPTEPVNGDIRALVQLVSWLKAAAVGPRVREGTILAADTVAWLDGKVIAKPADEGDARRILRFLSGRVHELWTGVCLWRRPDNLQVAWQEVTRVHFRALGESELEGYLATRQWQGCSGAYAIQEVNDPFIQVVDGSLSNVVGLPLESLDRIFREMTGQH